MPSLFFSVEALSSPQIAVDGLLIVGSHNEGENNGNTCTCSDAYGVLYDLSDDALEMRIYDSAFVQRFLRLEYSDRIPDAKAIWAFRELLTKNGAMENLFAGFNALLQQAGVTYSSGRIIDAKIIEVPKQRNSRDENEQIKNGETPDEWLDNEPKLRQKDVDARWTQKHGRSYFGFRDHTKVDEKTKLIMSYHVTDALVHDSQAVDDLLEVRDKDCYVYADSAYIGEDVAESIIAMKAKPRIIQRRSRNTELKESAKKRNRRIARHRARVEHVFGSMTNDLKLKVLRCIGIVRARAKIGLINLVYNMKRAMYLNRRRIKIGWT